ncbi:unnamed protein product [Caenorhabditis brenneri]
MEEDSRANEFLTPRALERVVRKYMHPELTDFINFSELGFDSEEIIMDNGELLLSGLLENSYGKLRPYEPAAMLTGRLRVYRKFTSANRYFGMNRMDPYNHSINKYLTSNGDTYYVKQDLLVKMQSDILEQYPKMKDLPRMILSIFLKNQEDFLAKTLEYVSQMQNQEAFLDIEKKIAETMEKFKQCVTKPVPAKLKKKMGKCKLENPNASIDAIFETWRAHVPMNWTAEQSGYIKEAIQFHVDRHPPEEEPRVYAEVAYTSHMLMDLLKEIFESYPQIYSPYTEIPRPYVLRVFNDVPEPYLLDADAQQIMHKVTNGAFIFQPDPFPTILTISLKDFMEAYGVILNNNNVIQISSSVYRIKRVTPVITYNGEFCVPSGFALNELIRRLAIGWKLFQRVKRHNVGRVLEDVMTRLRHRFNDQLPRLTFISQEGLVNVTEEIADYCAAFEEVAVEEVPEDILDSECLVLRNLKALVGRLVSTNTFPNRDHILQLIHKRAIDRIGGPQNWRVGIMFDLIEQLQVIGFIEKFPEILAFYHTQGIPHDKELCSRC